MNRRVDNIKKKYYSFKGIETRPVYRFYNFTNHVA